MIHKYSLFGQFVVLDVESGCVHVMDELSFYMLDFIDFEGLNKKINLDILFSKFASHSKASLLERYDSLYELYKNNMLFSKNEYSDVENLMANSHIKAVCLHVAHDCNLRCKYCFASTGDFKQGRKLMSMDVAKRAIDFLIDQSDNRKNLEVDFFGGEPSLNFEVVRGVISYARSLENRYNKNFRFTITTNGVLLNSESIDYLNENMSNIVLSLDGRKEVNDRMRILAGGGGSYDVVLRNFKALVKKRELKKENNDYYVRGTFTRHNLDFSKDLISMYEEGFHNISIEPVVCSENKDYSIRRKDLERVFEEYENLAKYIIKIKKEGKYINFFHFNVDLSQGPCLLKRLKGCGCGCEYVAISPEGDIYPCHQFVGEKDWFMGSIFNNNFNNNLKEKFSKINVITKSECVNCWAKYYCSGGCSANNYKYELDMLKPYKIACEMQKKRIECAIAIKAVFS